MHLAYGRSNREQLQEELGIDFTEDIDELIKQSDVVVVAAPPQVHYELGKKILSAGKDLWMEKPMAMNSGDAVEMDEMADGSDLIMLLGHLLCYSRFMDKFTLEASHTADEDERSFTVETTKGEVISWDILAPENQQDMLLDECKHFLECIEARQQPLTNGWHGVEVVKAMEAISPNQYADR